MNAERERLASECHEFFSTNAMDRYTIADFVLARVREARYVGMERAAKLLEDEPPYRPDLSDKIRVEAKRLGLIDMMSGSLPDDAGSRLLARLRCLEDLARISRSVAEEMKSYFDEGNATCGFCSEKHGEELECILYEHEDALARLDALDKETTK